MPNPWTATATGLRLRLRVTPNASLDRIDGPEVLADGTSVLRLRVRAVPENGKANAAVIQFLAKSLGLPKSAIALVAGETPFPLPVALGHDVAEHVLTRPAPLVTVADGSAAAAGAFEPEPEL